MKKFALIKLILLLLIFVSCDNDNDSSNNVCEENYVTDQMLNTFSNSNGYTFAAEWMDLETHEYTIKINADGEICSIGYQNPSTYTGGYTMEVINNTNPSANYSGTHTFSQTTLDYQNITPVLVSHGDEVTVKRTILPGYSNINEQVGATIRKTDGSNIPYPITAGNIIFLSSKIHGAGGPLDNYVQPVIGLGFKVH